MPIYLYRCHDCETEAEQLHGMFASPSACACGSFNIMKVPYAPVVHHKGADLQARNGGRGEYFGQLAKRPDVIEPDLFYTSRKQAVEIAKRRTHGTAQIEM